MHFLSCLTPLNRLCSFNWHLWTKLFTPCPMVQSLKNSKTKLELKLKVRKKRKEERKKKKGERKEERYLSSDASVSATAIPKPKLRTQDCHPDFSLHHFSSGYCLEKYLLNFAVLDRRFLLQQVKERPCFFYLSHNFGVTIPFFFIRYKYIWELFHDTYIYENYFTRWLVIPVENHVYILASAQSYLTMAFNAHLQVL